MTGAQQPFRCRSGWTVCQAVVLAMAGSARLMRMSSRRKLRLAAVEGRLRRRVADALGERALLPHESIRHAVGGRRGREAGVRYERVAGKQLGLSR